MINEDAPAEVQQRKVLLREVERLKLQVKGILYGAIFKRCCRWISPFSGSVFSVPAGSQTSIRSC